MVFILYTAFFHAIGILFGSIWQLFGSIWNNCRKNRDISPEKNGSGAGLEGRYSCIGNDGDDAFIHRVQ